MPASLMALVGMLSVIAVFHATSKLEAAVSMATKGTGTGWGW